MTTQTENIDHLSYSTCKKIYRKGIDYALGTKLGLIDETYGQAADIGNIIHNLVLGGTFQWTVSPYKDFKSNEAKEWKANQVGAIIKESELEGIKKVAVAIGGHPLAKELIELCDLEQKLEGNIGSVKFVGCADGISKDRKTIFDLKTTAQFDQFKWQAFKNDYDLQASVYSLFGDNCEYFFVVAETVAPFRVQVFGTAQEFIEGGDRKLQKTIDAFDRFRLRPGANDLERISFNVGETQNLNQVEQLGDFS